MEPMVCDGCNGGIFHSEDDHRVLDTGDVLCVQCFERQVDTAILAVRRQYGQQIGPEETYRLAKDMVRRQDF